MAAGEPTRTELSRSWEEAAEALAWSMKVKAIPIHMIAQRLDRSVVDTEKMLARCYDKKRALAPRGEDMRLLATAQLEALLAECWKDIEAENPKGRSMAIRNALAALDRICKLHGLDAPTKAVGVHLHSNLDRMTTQELRDHALRLGLSLSDENETEAIVRERKDDAGLQNQG